MFAFLVPVANRYLVFQCQRSPECLVGSCLRSRQIANPSRPLALRRMERCDRAFETAASRPLVVRVIGSTLFCQRDDVPHRKLFHLGRTHLIPRRSSAPK
jgi:hypothetical protein